MIENAVDLSFPIAPGSRNLLPRDHGYHLYSSIARRIPSIHEGSWAGVHLLQGEGVGPREIRLVARSTLTLRLPVNRIPEVLPLAGKSLCVGPASLSLGPPSIFGLRPVENLHASMVMIKITRLPPRGPAYIDELRECYRVEIERQLANLDIMPADFSLTRQRVFHVKDKKSLGFSMEITGLSPEASLRLQTVGVGGKRSMGAGIFVPSK